MKKAWMIWTAAALMALGGCGEEKTLSEENQEILEAPETEETEEIREYEIEISDKLSDFQFAIDGEVKQLPSRMEDWLREGWKYQEEGARLEAESYAEGKLLEKGEESLRIDGVNLSGEEKAIEDCYVGGVALEYQEGGSVYQLPGGITLGKASLGQVKEAYGVPADEYEEKEEIYLTYEFGLYKKADLVFDIEEEILTRASLKNYREPEEKEVQISEEIPEAVKSYERPEGFSKNPTDYIVSYGGEFYRIPAPVSEFTEHGWRVEEEGSDAYVKAGRHGYVTLEREGKTIYAVVKNYGESAVEVENTFVTNLSGDFDVTKIPILAGDGIALGMSKEEVIARLGGSSYEEQKEEGGTSYVCYSDETKKNYLKIFVDQDLGLVREIQVSNSPQSLGSRPREEAGENMDSSALTEEDMLPKE